MHDMLMQYGLFLAQALTVVVAIAAVIIVVAVTARRGAGTPQLDVRRLDERLDAERRTLRRALVPAKRFRTEERARRRAAKRDAGDQGDRRRVYVLGFKGDLRASAVAALREEVSAVLGVAGGDDEVVVRLENPGGLVHEHGLAASQLLRVKTRGIKLTVVVDKIAASGGYMMACTADRIVAAPFAILGSIGVLMQLPNFNRLLESHGVDFETIKGGDHKRTLTLFGKNTDVDRARMREDIEHVHDLFKGFVAEHRPGLDVARVATGEHWFGSRALELGLCDAIGTSDDYLLGACDDAHVVEISYRVKQPLGKKLLAAASAAASAAAAHVAERLVANEHTRRPTGG